MASKNFGAFVRREREAREIGLREMAKKIGVSPTYMSKVERDEFTPPTEDKVRSIARILECDPDELLAMAGRIPSDLADIIKRAPVEVSALVRTTSGMTRDEIARLAAVMRRIWVRSDRNEISNQHDLAQWLGVKVCRLPLDAHYDDTALRGALCLCPVDIDAALRDAGHEFEIDGCGDYSVTGKATQ